MVELARRTEVSSRTAVIVPYLDYGEDGIYVGLIESEKAPEDNTFKLPEINLKGRDSFKRACARGITKEIGYEVETTAIQAIDNAGSMEAYAVKIPLNTVKVIEFKGSYWMRGFNWMDFGSRWDDRMGKWGFHLLSEAVKLVSEDEAVILERLQLRKPDQKQKHA